MNKSKPAKITNRFGTFILNSKFRVSQRVKIKDITGRHGTNIGTCNVAISEACDKLALEKIAIKSYVKKGEILNKKFEVVSI